MQDSSGALLLGATPTPDGIGALKQLSLMAPRLAFVKDLGFLDMMLVLLMSRAEE